MRSGRAGLARLLGWRFLFRRRSLSARIAAGRRERRDDLLLLLLRPGARALVSGGSGVLEDDGQVQGNGTVLSPGPVGVGGQVEGQGEQRALPGVEFERRAHPGAFAELRERGAGQADA
ncbi:hypothetical protein CFK39_06325 [Brachybacterium avium]|uniref:Uncharacterized protein n=1 Tax=Brachybacterium avium TaxID=2017485 RepID=A0A220UBV2_9MICO|nr:hypothetical protein [Brachybacterium avium]ASK65510.1 hypothetical protein CFK39_06325 [Brachybacterium avium]